MSAAVQIARYGGVFANLTAVITALQGPSTGLQWTMRTLSSLDHDLAPKYASVGGTQIGPVAVTLAGSEPKWSGEMNMVEAKEIQAWLGAGWGGIRLNIDVTWQIPGNAAFTDNIRNTFLGPCSVSAKKDDVVMAKIGANCTSILPNGIDPFAQVTS